MLDATKSDEQRRLLEIELDAVGIRLNKQRPDVVFKRKTTGGVCNFLVTHETILSCRVTRSRSIQPSNSRRPMRGQFDLSWLLVSASPFL